MTATGSRASGDIERPRPKLGARFPPELHEGRVASGAQPRPFRRLAMPPISRGFRGRRQTEVDPSRLPPGQYATNDFPVLSAGPTPHTPLDEWSFTLGGAVGGAKAWTWGEVVAIPSEGVTRDIHCVTKGSKFDTHWRRGPVGRPLRGTGPLGQYLVG